MAQRAIRRHVGQPPRVGLVLGAGGVLGGAWMVGALAALERVTGWDPRGADYLLGTSAGAVFAGLLGAGVPPSSLLPPASVEGRPEGSWLLAELTRESTYRPASWLPHAPFGSWRLALSGALQPPSRRSLLHVLSGLVPAGRVPAGPILRTIARTAGRSWAVHPRCRIVATDYATGRRVVFGETGAPRTSLAVAVAASCAIPGYFEPVIINGRRYVDGGLGSLCNLDLLHDIDLDVVICFSAMTAQRQRPEGSLLNRAVGYLLGAATKQLSQQVEALRGRGTEVIVIEPTLTDQIAMGSDLMLARRWSEVLKSGMSSVAALLRRHRIRARLQALAGTA